MARSSIRAPWGRRRLQPATASPNCAGLPRPQAGPAGPGRGVSAIRWSRPWRGWRRALWRGGGLRPHRRDPFRSRAPAAGDAAPGGRRASVREGAPIAAHYLAATRLRINAHRPVATGPRLVQDVPSTARAYFASTFTASCVSSRTWPLPPPLRRPAAMRRVDASECRRHPERAACVRCRDPLRRIIAAPGGASARLGFRVESQSDKRRAGCRGHRSMTRRSAGRRVDAIGDDAVA